MKLKAKKTKSFNFSLSELDYNHLQKMAKELEIKPAEYLRTLIQVTWLAKNFDKETKDGTLHIGGYGITFPPEFLQDFAEKLENTFTEVDWDNLANKITITGQRHYRPNK